jgi:hypothetical protein
MFSTGFQYTGNKFSYQIGVIAHGCTPFFDMVADISGEGRDDRIDRILQECMSVHYFHILSDTNQMILERTNQCVVAFHNH